MGCRVATLFSGSAEAGSHVVKLQDGVANGNYVVVLSGEQASVVQPVRIVK